MGVFRPVASVALSSITGPQVGDVGPAFCRDVCCQSVFPWRCPHLHGLSAKQPAHKSCRINRPEQPAGTSPEKQLMSPALSQNPLPAPLLCAGAPSGPHRGQSTPTLSVNPSPSESGSWQCGCGALRTRWGGAAHAEVGLQQLSSQVEPPGGAQAWLN